MEWHLTDLRLRIAATVSRADLAAELIRRADATAHSAATNLVDLRKTRATGEGLAWAEAAVAEQEAEAGSVAAAAVVVAAAEAVEEAVAVVAGAAAAVAGAAAGDASWRSGSV
jgi:hypothetical protein